MVRNGHRLIALLLHIVFGLSNNKPEVCNVLGDCITLRLTADQTDGYSVAEFKTPGGVGQLPHTHDWDETYVVLEGALNLNVDGQATIVPAGGTISSKREPFMLRLLMVNPAST